MRLLSNVIHPGQYTSSVSSYCPAELTSDASVQETEQPEDEASESAAPLQTAEAGAGEAERREQVRRQEETQVRQVMDRAFLKARQIVDSAQEYSAEVARKAHETIAEESAEAKKRGYTDGYAQGSEKGRQEGSDAGYRAGFEEGRKKAEADNRKSLDELGMMIESVEKSKTKILSTFEDDLIDLSTTMAKAILKQELHSDEKALRNIIVSAMEEYRNQEWIRIYVPEETASVLLKADSSIADALQGISDSVKVVVSKGMEEGSCIIETPDQVIDAGVDSQLTKIRQAISEAMRKQPGTET